MASLLEDSESMFLLASGDGEAAGVSAVPAWLLPALLAGLVGLPGLAADIAAPCFADPVCDSRKPVTLSVAAAQHWVHEKHWQKRHHLEGLPPEDGEEEVEMGFGSKIYFLVMEEHADAETGKGNAGKECLYVYFANQAQLLSATAALGDGMMKAVGLLPVLLPHTRPP
ncbi:MAG: hypothetical protein FRX49_06834 [Trebouxia sp. A1-2]|nr:MAG: hypothetical protein FRX49_06834 [Trebouxia sp. A1-2]